MEQESKTFFTTNMYPEFLAIVYAILKLTGVIDWSWWWVVSPILLFAAFFAVIFIIVVIIYFARELVHDRENDRFG